jgi:hypothetical protein
MNSLVQCQIKLITYILMNDFYKYLSDKCDILKMNINFNINMRKFRGKNFINISYYIFE